MLEITRRARGELSEMLGRALSQRPEPTGDEAFRLLSGNHDLGLMLDAPRDGDDVYDHEGRPLLLIDSDVGDLVEDLVLDVLEVEGQHRLALRDT